MAVPTGFHVVVTAGGARLLTPMAGALYSDAGAPAADVMGREGDHYMDSTTGDLYQYTGGVWVMDFAMPTTPTGTATRAFAMMLGG